MIQHKTLSNIFIFLTVYLYSVYSHAELINTAQKTTSNSGTLINQSQIKELGLKACRRPGNGEIPLLNWQERSDWINIKTDIKNPAKGDGIQDDTAAIQFALNLIGKKPGDPKVVYFPAGIYRITDTLSLTKRNGAMLIGHGRDTQLIWDGEKNKRMFWSNGAPRITYNGFIFDGKGIASVGIDHDSKSLYETRVIHENIEFRNFTNAGIRVGHDQKLASAEMLFTNLKFVNNKHGALFQSWNDYNNVFDGCHFINNKFGIHAEKGNITVRNSRFEKSRQSDLLLSTHSHSIRRVVSSGSNAFIETVRGPISNSLIKVQDSLISNWKNKNGAIITQLRGPLTIFDTTFANPPSSAPPIRLNNPPYMNQLAIISNVSSPNTKSVIKEIFNSSTMKISRQNKPVTLLKENQQFLRSDIIQPSRIIDVKQDCNAKGNGRNDDTKAIQSCFELAHKTKKSSLVYFPSGKYRVSSTLKIPDNASFTIDGTGWHSKLIWHGKRAGILMHVNNPAGLKISHLTLGGPAQTTTLLQTGNKPSWVKYHNLFGYHGDERKNVEIVFNQLPENTLVLSDHIDGRIRIRNSSKATLLFGNIISVQMIIEGNSQQTGFLGVLSRTSALEKFPLIIRDNQSLVMTDWYNEQTEHLLSMEGNSQKTGRVILDHSQSASTDTLITKTNNYSGLLTHSGGMFGRSGNKSAVSIESSNNSNIDILLLGNMYWHKSPQLLHPKEKSHISTNSINKKGMNPIALVENKIQKNTLSKINKSFDAFRELSEYDLLLNYCISTQ